MRLTACASRPDVYKRQMQGGVPPDGGDLLSLTGHLNAHGLKDGPEGQEGASALGHRGGVGEGHILAVQLDGDAGGVHRGEGGDGQGGRKSRSAAHRAQTFTDSIHSFKNEPALFRHIC